MNKRYLFYTLFLLMITLSGCTLANKPLPFKSEYPNNIKFNLNDGILPLNNPLQVNMPQEDSQDKSSNINQDKKAKTEPVKQIKSTGDTSIKQGDKGDKVKEIQQKLNKFNYKLNIDSNFGISTYFAILDFQTRNKIPRDGIVGELTLKKLDTALASENIYKSPVNPNSISKVSGSNNALEKYINSKNFSSVTTYFVWIDLSNQKVNIFNGIYNNWTLVKSMVCSSGKASTPTIKGFFTVGSKGSYFISDGGARCKDYTQISGNYLFHSVLYNRSGNNIIDGTLGVPVSHGCVRLALENAKFIYDNIQVGTTIWSN